MGRGGGGDSNQVVYVDGDVPQRPLQLGQLLVDSSQISPGTTNLQQCTSQDPLVYEPVAGKPVPAGNVLNYGADPTGAVDSSAAFNDAVAVNGYVYVPPGVYLIESTIVLPTSRIITGPSQGTLATQAVLLIDAVPAGATIRTGTAQAGTETTITLDVGASGADDAYNYMLIRLTSGTGAGQWVGIVDYNGTTKVATIDRAFTTTPDNTTGFEISEASHLFQDTAGGFGGSYIGNFDVQGGNGTGSFCVYSTRPQSVFTGIHMEGSGYNKNGIAITDGAATGDGSWECEISNSKWVGPASHTNYRAFLVNVDGGNVELDHVLAVRGSVGIEVVKCEALRIYKADMNIQSSDFSSETTDKGQCGVRFTGTGPKKAVSIDSSYLEGSSTALWIESLESGSLNDTYIDDLGNGGLPQINLLSSDSKNLTIKSSDINSRSTGGTAIKNAGTGLVVMGSQLAATGSAASIVLDNSGTGTYVFNNRITGHASGTSIKTTTAMQEFNNTVLAGNLDDASQLIVNSKFVVGTVAQLIAATNRGARALVTDATATTFASVVAGGGANVVPVYSDGTNWRIG